MNRHTLLPLIGFMLLNATVSADDYDVYLLAGQSNMDGRGDASKLKPDQLAAIDRVTIFYRNPPHQSDGWQPLGPGFSIPPKFKGKVPSDKFGPELGFGRWMSARHPDRKIALIKGSKGGTSLRREWNPGLAGKPETQGERYRWFLETIKDASTPLTSQGHKLRIRGLLWHQGEADRKLPEGKYQELLDQFIGRIRADVGVAELPVVVGEVFDNGQRDIVRAGIQAVAKSNKLVGLASAEGLTTWDEGTHFDAASQLLLGQRFAEAMLEIESNP